MVSTNVRARKSAPAPRVIYPMPVDRQPPRATSDEIDLYIRTYYSLLRSSGDVRVRAFEEAHLFSRSSLHLGAADAEPDLAAFAYSAGRLPDCMPRIRRIVLGQIAAPVPTRPACRSSAGRSCGRAAGAARCAGTAARRSRCSSPRRRDIDDLVPILTAYQIEWNKLRERLLAARISDVTDDAALAGALGDDEPASPRLRGALGPRSSDILRDMIAHDCDLFVRLLDGSFREYQRSAQRWWHAIAPGGAAGPPGLLRVVEQPLAREPARRLRARSTATRSSRSCARRNFEDLAPRYDEAIAAGDDGRRDRTSSTTRCARSSTSPSDEAGMDQVQESDARGRHPRDRVAGQDRRRRAGDRALAAAAREPRSAPPRARHRAARARAAP